MPMLSTVATAQTVRPCQKWRGFGRAAFRAGTTAAGSIAYARQFVAHELDEVERALVMAGWDDESRLAMECA